MVQYPYPAIGKAKPQTEPRYDRYPVHLAIGKRKRRQSLVHMVHELLREVNDA